MPVDGASAPGSLLAEPLAQRRRSKETSLSSVEKRELFCQSFCVSFNATAAAGEAGYAFPNKQANNLMKEPAVQARIAEIIAARKSEIQSAEFPVLAMIREVVERCMAAVPVVVKGVPVEGEWTFDATSALRGLELLGKHEGLFPTRMDVTVTEAKAKETIKRALTIVAKWVEPDVFRAIVADLEAAGDA